MCIYMLCFMYVCVYVSAEDNLLHSKESTLREWEQTVSKRTIMLIHTQSRQLLGGIIFVKLIDSSIWIESYRGVFVL